VKNIRIMEKVQKVYFSDVSGAPWPRGFMLQTKYLLKWDSEIEEYRH
jgi:hypothetical protein